MSDKYQLDLGKVAYSGKARNNRVVVEVRLERKASVAPHLTIDLKTCDEYVEFAATGEIWNAAGTDTVSGGQNQEDIGTLFPDNERVQRLVEIWRRWHLNGMKAGTRRQMNLLADAEIKDYDKAVKFLEKCNALHTQGPDCEDYQYGHGWLVEPLPEEVEREVRELCEAIVADKRGDAEPDDFVTRHGITATVQRVDSNPNMPDRDMDHWKVTFCRGRKRMTVPFSMGSGHGGKPPTALEVLACLADDSASADEDFVSWCGNLGMSVDSVKAGRLYKTVRRQAARLRKFLGDALFDELLDGNEA